MSPEQTALIWGVIGGVCVGMVLGAAWFGGKRY